MCFSGEQAGFFSALSVVGAGVVYYQLRNIRASIAMLYFAAMEFLQFVQYKYLAVPEDDYAMCKDPTNQFLTFIGLVHIVFQPVFVNMYIRCLLARTSLKNRIERDLIHRICLLAAMWFLVRYVAAVYFPDLPHLAPRPSKECPNYEWVREGYDGNIGWDTPNLPGHSCTFRSNTPTGHLAWATPLYQATYFMPGASLHLFLMVAPHVFCEKWYASIILFVTGPLLAAYITASNNEQASIWCFYSTYQVLAGAIIACFSETAYPKAPEKIRHAGDLGDGPLTYVLVPEESKTKSTKSAS